MQSEFVLVPKEFKAHVIGKRGSVIREIRQKSGAQIASTSTEEEGFTTSGNAQQIAHAKRLILQKVEEVKRGTWDLVEIPAEYKGLIIGKGGANLHEISEQTGAEVSRRRGEVYITSGTEHQRAQAKVNLGIKLAGARLRGVENEFNKVCCFVDGCNLPENFGLKLEQVLEDDRMVLLGAHKQYRLKPSQRFESQESFVSNSNDPSYLVELARAALESLHMLKREREENGSLEADMWCHFGAAIIRGASEEEASEREWSIDEVAGKFQPSAEKKYWKVAFNEGVDFVEDIFKGHFKRASQENTEYVARYDLTYLSPGGYQLRCKVWEAKEDVKKKLQDIPIPFSDVKNILEEIHFEDESTRSRCRGWLVYPSRRYLQADILFPGCEFDCRLTIRGRAESAEAIDYVPKEEVRRTLSQYLSGLTLTKDEPLGLRLPENQIPEGFYLIHMQSSKRTVYATKPGFSIILSKKYSWRSVIGEERARESTDLHLHCDEWDQLLSSGKWEPKVILQKLPEFLQFVKEVQGFVVREMQRIRKKVPPEILARGPLALEAYNNALAEGKTCVKRVPLMLIGQDRSGKTSLKKSLKGIDFDPDEDSTVGIDVDRYHFKVTTETWMTGKKDEESTCDAEAISFEYNAARLVAERLMKVDSVTGNERRAGVGSGEFEIADMLMDTHLHESFTGPESIDPSSRDPTQIDTMREPVAPAGEVTDLAQLTQGEDALVATQVQRSHFEEVAVRTETLLQNGLEESNNDIHSTMWDFAGQSVYYVTHPLFLTAKAIYLLAYDLSQNPHDIAKPVVKQGVYKKIQENPDQKTNLDYLDFWMTSVASLASVDKDDDEDHKSEVLPKKLPAVFLVCTHADKPYNGCDPFELAYEIFGTLKNKPYGPHLSGVFVVDNTKSGSEFECEQVKHLREAVLAIAKELPHVNEVIPIKWLRYEKCIEILKNERHHISLAQAKHLASKECIINKESEIVTLLNFLHELRLIIHFDDTSELNDMVVLDPQWLIDIFKKVITVRPYHWKENQYFHLWRKLEREGILEEKLLKHVWSSLIPQTETFESLIAIMEKFSLLCPWPLQGVSCGKQYLVPSMLKSLPPKVITDLVVSAQIPSLFLNFEAGQVPRGFFPRFVLEFFQWCTGRFPRQEPPQLFNGFARFYILPKEGCSVVLLCHSLSIELVILTSNAILDTSVGNLACAIRNQLASIIDCMQNKFFGVKNVACELNFLCPVCCRGREVSYCRNHHAESCKQEECLHFFPDSKLATGDIQVCNRSAIVQDNRVSVAHFASWFPSEDDKPPMSEEHDGRLLSFVEDELPEISPALPCNILRPVQPVNQPEVEVGNESAGRSDHSKLATGDIQVCNRSTSANFAPWFPSEEEKEPVSDEHDGRLLSLVEDELPEMSPALPCNIVRPVQPVNQPEVEVGNECSGSNLVEHDIWNAVINFEAEHEQCIRVLPYLQNGQVEIHLYVYNDRSGIPTELENAAEAFFGERGWKLVWADLYNDAFNLLKVTSIDYSSRKPERLEASQVDKIDAIINNHLHVFSKHRNVTAVQPSFKVTNSKQTQEACIVVYVLGKGKIPLGETEIPCTIDFYPVDIVNGFFVKTKDPYLPKEAHEQNEFLRLGASIGVKGKQSSGTLGAIVEDVNSGTLYALSCDHVTYDAVQSEIIHPGLDVFLNYLRYHLGEYKGWIEKVTGPDDKLPQLIDDSLEETLLQKLYSDLKTKKDKVGATTVSQSQYKWKMMQSHEGKLEEAFGRRPRVIAKYRAGVRSNVQLEMKNGKEHFIDAAISELNEEEVQKVKAETEVVIIGTKHYPSGECLSATADVEDLFKSGSATGFTQSNRLADELGDRPTYIRVKGNGRFIDVRCINCRNIAAAQLQAQDLVGPCEQCKPERWLKRCVCIQQQGKEPFSDNGDSGAVVFEKRRNKLESPGFAIIFGELETQYYKFAIASPLEIALEALSQKVSVDSKPCQLKLASKFKTI